MKVLNADMGEEKKQGHLESADDENGFKVALFRQSYGAHRGEQDEESRGRDTQTQSGEPERSKRVRPDLHHRPCHC